MRLYRGLFVHLAALAVALAWTGPSTRADTVALGASGWVASWSPFYDDPSSPSHLSAQFVSQDATSVHVNLTSTFGAPLNMWGSFDAIPIAFQGGAGHTPFVVFDNLTLTNNTGTPWACFTFKILGGNTGTTQDARFDDAQTAIGQPGGLDISPFTTFDYQANNQVLNLINGLLPSGAATNMTGGLVVSAGNESSFTFKEVPTPGTNETPAPATVWAGLVLIALLGALRLRLPARRGRLC